MLKVELGWSCRGFCVSFWKGEFTLKERIACNRIKLHVCVKTNNVMSLDCLIYHLSFGKTKGANYSPSVLRQVNFAIEVCSIKQGVIYFPLIKAVMSQFKFSVCYTHFSTVRSQGKPLSVTSHQMFFPPIMVIQTWAVYAVYTYCLGTISCKSEGFEQDPCIFTDGINAIIRTSYVNILILSRSTTSYAFTHHTEGLYPMKFKPVR